MNVPDPACDQQIMDFVSKKNHRLNGFVGLTMIKKNRFSLLSLNSINPLICVICGSGFSQQIRNFVFHNKIYNLFEKKTPQERCKDVPPQERFFWDEMMFFFCGQDEMKLPKRLATWG